MRGIISIPKGSSESFGEPGAEVDEPEGCGCSRKERGGSEGREVVVEEKSTEEAYEELSKAQEEVVCLVGVSIREVISDSSANDDAYLIGELEVTEEEDDERKGEGCPVLPFHVGFFLPVVTNE